MESYDKANFFLMSEEFVSSSALYNNLRNFSNPNSLGSLSPISIKNTHLP